MQRMGMSKVREQVNAPRAGEQMYAMIEQMYPLCRSITGDGVRRTLDIVGQHIPLTIHEVPSGTPAFDWTVPDEWNLRNAYIRNPRGETVLDFHESNLHVVSYSMPVHRTITLDELKSHAFTLPDHPDWIPYRTSYYEKNWGFCLPHNELLRWQPGKYEVLIDSSLTPGSLTYGELTLPGASEDIVLVSCHICHPSMCNDNLSGISLVTLLAQELQEVSLRHTFVFLFIPGTIGSIVWLCANRERARKVAHGLVVNNVGDAGPLQYKKSRRGDSEIDRAAVHVLAHSGAHFQVREFDPYGYDERQFCSPGFNLPVGSLTRSHHGSFPEYHTSADNPDFVRPEYLGDSLSKYMAIFDVLESNRTYYNQNPFCEPQLGKRGLYRKVGGHSRSPAEEVAMLWLLNLSDGSHSLLDIAERSGIHFPVIQAQAQRLFEHGLLSERAPAAPVSTDQDETVQVQGDNYPVISG